MKLLKRFIAVALASVILSGQSFAVYDAANQDETTVEDLADLGYVKGHLILNRAKVEKIFDQTHPLDPTKGSDDKVKNLKAFLLGVLLNVETRSPDDDKRGAFLAELDAAVIRGDGADIDVDTIFKFDGSAPLAEHIIQTAAGGLWAITGGGAFPQYVRENQDITRVADLERVGYKNGSLILNGAKVERVFDETHPLDPSRGINDRARNAKTFLISVLQDVEARFPGADKRRAFLTILDAAVEKKGISGDIYVDTTEAGFNVAAIPTPNMIQKAADNVWAEIASVLEMYSNRGQEKGELFFMIDVSRLKIKSLHDELARVTQALTTEMAALSELQRKAGLLPTEESTL